MTISIKKSFNIICENYRRIVNILQLVENKNKKSCYIYSTRIHDICRNDSTGYDNSVYYIDGIYHMRLTTENGLYKFTPLTKIYTYQMYKQNVKIELSTFTSMFNILKDMTHCIKNFDSSLRNTQNVDYDSTIFMYAYRTGNVKYINKILNRTIENNPFEIKIDSVVDFTPDMLLRPVDTSYYKDDGSPMFFIDDKLVSKNYADKLIDGHKLSLCDYCGNIILPESISYEVDNIHLCSKCFYDNCSYCDECGALHFIQNLTQGLCHKCWNAKQAFRVNNYSYQPPTMKYYTKPQLYTENGSKFKGLGIELEVDGSGERCKMSEMVQEMLRNEVYIKHDGSLNKGFEIITYPHTEKSFYDMPWEQTLLSLIKHGYRSHDIKTCGLHMHISRSCLTKKQLQYLIYFFEKNKEDLLKFSRRDKEHAEKWASFYTDKDTYRHANGNFEGKPLTLQLCKQIIETYDNKHNHDLRYHAVNLQNRNTIEFRLMRGTLNYATFMATINFLLTIIKNSKKITDETVDDISVWLKGISAKTKLYLKKRKCFGYTSEKDIEECDL